MKRSEYVRKVSRAIDGMFNHVGDGTKIGMMFGKMDQRSGSGEFTKDDFVEFYYSPYLKEHIGLWGDLIGFDGRTVDDVVLGSLVADALLAHFQAKGLTKDKTFKEAFYPPNWRNILEFQFFDEMAEVIVSALETVARPPLFHGRADKIIRYDWEENRSKRKTGKRSK